MSKVLIFAGTTEGRMMAEYLAARQLPTHVCVATAYGESLLPQGARITVSHERLDCDEMARLMTAIDADPVIDATHPYADVATDNIKAACVQAGKEYLRLIRDAAAVTDEQVVFVDSVKAAVAYLEGTQGTILAVTGSKELAAYTKLSNYQNRVFARVLSLPEVAAECARLGFTGKQLICMQGPFSKELNMAMIRQLGTSWMVTKESGRSGGFREKYEAAAETGTKLIVVGRPGSEIGMTIAECKTYLQQRFQLSHQPEIALVGIGMGTDETLTGAARQTCQNADLIIGARRMVDSLCRPGQQCLYAYQPEQIRDYINAHPEYEKIAIVLSGDVGFYSGARKLLAVLGPEVKVVCGISAMIYFCARLQTPWEDVIPVSMHGRAGNLIGKIKNHARVFAIVGNTDGIGLLCQQLQYYGLGAVTVYIGERLSYPDERIMTGPASDFSGCETDALSVVLIENPAADKRIVTQGIPDQLFLRDKAPMTKAEIRSISLSKLRLTKAAVVYDIGAGSGSVSIEMAEAASHGTVFAIEKNDAAVALLHRNKQQFASDNLTIIEGFAPEACLALPVPSHAFIGGSSGNLRAIMELLLDKNPAIRMVINCITLETVSELLHCLAELPLTDVDIVQVTVGKSREVGAYHMMTGQNPVYIISCEGRTN